MENALRDTFANPLRSRNLQANAGDISDIRITWDLQSGPLYQLAGDQFAAYVERLMKLGAFFFKENLKVNQVVGRNKVGMQFCKNFNIPAYDQDMGVSDSDLHIYIDIINDATSPEIMSSVPCSFVLPKYRVNSGKLTFNIAHFEINNYEELAYDSKRFEDTYVVLIHEMFRLLGFDKNLYQFWFNPTTNAPWGAQADQLKMHPIYGTDEPAMWITTPKVKEYASQYYSCPDIEGQQVENFGPTTINKSGFWEKNVLPQEIMTCEFDTERAQITNFTWKVLEDTQWYFPKYRQQDNYSFGKGKGCDFIRKRCIGTNFSEYALQEQACSLYHEGIASPYEDQYLDRCPLMETQPHRLCSDAKNFMPGSMDMILGNEFGRHSRCFESTVIEAGIENNPLDNVRCHRFRCNENNQVTIVIQGEDYPCQNNICQIAKRGKNQFLEGVVNVPQNTEGLCQTWPRPCQEHCSQNGYCQNGRCHCKPGSAGFGCEQKCDGLLVDGNCNNIDTCPTGTEPLLFARMCKTIQMKCGPNKFNFNNVECLDVCPNGYFGNTKGQCQACDEDCSRCNGHTCEVCNTGYFKLSFATGSKCVQECPSGFYIDQTSMECKSCPDMCQTCSSPQACDSCGPDKFFMIDFGECMEKCFTGYYADSARVCKVCHSQCANSGCTGPEPNQCKSCASNPNTPYKFMDYCVPECPEGYFVSKDDEYTCERCNETCGTCYGPSPYQCNSCPGPITTQTTTGEATQVNWYYIHEKHSCTRSCQMSGYSFTNQQQLICEQCAGCRTCGTQKDICTSCHQGQYLKDSQCVYDCPNGFFKDETNLTCAPCPTTCSTCESNLKCSSCNSGFFFFEQYQECLQYIPRGYYLDPTNNVLIQCRDNCESCSNGTSCDSCKEGLVFNAGECGTSCPSGTFYEQSANICEPCDEQCKECETNQSQYCLQCKPDFYSFIESGTKVLCLNQCPNGTVGTAIDQTDGTVKRECTQCNKLFHHCSACSLDSCFACASSPTTTNTEEQFFLKEMTASGANTSSQCVPANECGEGFFPDWQSMKCQPCSPACATCSQQYNDTCQSCKSGFYLAYGSYCTAECPQGTWANSDKTCVKCNDGCQSCGQNGQCTSCYTGLFLHSGECKQQCPEGFFEDKITKVCAPCADQCTHCFGPSPQQCEGCSNNYFLIDTYCTDICYEGMFSNPTTGACEKCPNNCATCVMTSGVVICESCYRPYVLSNDATVNTCVNQECEPVGEYQDPASMICKDCYEGCHTCQGSGFDECSSCREGWFLSEQHKCVKDCPQGTFADANKNVCQYCMPTCKTCTHIDVCQTCHQGYFHNSSGQLCVKQCPEGQVGNDQTGECEDCSSNCKSCYGKFDFQCSSCYDPKVLVMNQDYSMCYDECPFGSYVKDGKCQHCNEICLQCNEARHICTECRDGLFLIDNTCKPQCPLGNFHDKIQRKCVACADNCNKCSETGYCYECSNGFHINSDGVCQQGCAQGYILQNSRCIPCQEIIPGCTLCFPNGTDVTCETCQEPQYHISQAPGSNNHVCAEGCQDGYYLTQSANGLYCESCDEGCKKCHGPGECIECLPGIAFLFRGKCSDECPQGSFQENTSTNGSQCLPCAPNCQSCTNGADDCQSCRPGFLHLAVNNANTCVEECPAGQYANYYARKCEPCSPMCGTCYKSAQQCTSCDQGMLWNGMCIAACPEGTAMDQANMQCVKCHFSCETCYGSAKNQCSKCSPNMIFNELSGECVPSCPVGTFAKYTSSMKMCMPCAPTCQSCANEATTCTSCASPLFLVNGQCHLQAPDGYYLTTSGELRKCPPTCKTCTDAERCTLCKYGFQIQQAIVNNLPIMKCLCPMPQYSLTINNFNKCVSQCPEGYYNDLKVLFNSMEVFTCKKCRDGCDTCSSATDCTVCAQGQQYVNGVCECDQGSFQFMERCVQDCPAGYFGDAQMRQCLVCKSNCLTCNSATECTACADNQVFSPEGVCIPFDMCPTGTFATPNHTKCQECRDGCNLCNNYEECEICEDGFFMTFGQCVQRCPVGQYGNIEAKYCMDCDSTCQRCNQDACQECKPDFIMLHGVSGTNVASTCVQECPTGKFAMQTTTGDSQFCHDCPSQCVSCTSKMTCQVCQSDFVFYDGKCLQHCPAGTVVDSNRQCKPCSIENCNYCYMVDVTGTVPYEQCERCSPGYFQVLIETSTPENSMLCQEECPVGHFALQTATSENGFCSSCHPNCKSCFGRSQDECLECQQGKKLLGESSCVYDCPHGTLPKESASNPNMVYCQKCAPFCDGCSGNMDNCERCIEGMFFNDSTCIDQCPEGSVPNKYTMTCDPCHDSCSSCFGITQYQCTNCKTGFFHLQEKEACFEKCPNGFIGLNGQCVRCSPECRTCGQTQDKCTECNQGYFQDFVQNEMTCSKECQNGKYGDWATQKCEVCHSACKTCFGQGQDSCLSCNAGYLQHYKACVKYCPRGFFNSPNEAICQQCGPTCVACSGNMDNCIKCKEGLYLNEETGECLYNCVAGTYPDRESGVCMNCGYKCSKCEQDGSCYSCQDGFVLNEDYKCQHEQVVCTLGQTEVNGKCVDCSAGCQECGPSTIDVTIGQVCYKCSQGQLLTPSRQCLGYAEKLDGYYADMNLGRFVRCNERCTQCTSKQVCTECISGFFLNGEQCQQGCPKGQYISETSGVQECKDCQADCQNCWGSADVNCYECVSGKILHKYQCLDECPAGTYKQWIVSTASTVSGTDAWFEQAICERCSPQCKTCYKSPDNCMLCNEGFFYYQGKCIENCPVKFYEDKTTQECMNCNDSCLLCYGSKETNCKLCVSGFYLSFPNTCTNACSDGYYANDQTGRCDRCNADICSKCDKAADNCSACAPGRYMVNGWCQDSCPVGTYGNLETQECVKCMSGCEECTGPSIKHCTSCGGNLVFQEETQSCGYKCLESTYPDYTLNICKPCPIGCNSCDGPDRCNKCAPEYFLFHQQGKVDKVCVKYCPKGYFHDRTNMNCKKCADECKTCERSATECSSCADGYAFLKEKMTCLDYSPVGYYLDPESNHYIKCQEPCEICSGRDQCSKCLPNFFLQTSPNGSYCTANCPQGTYRDFQSQTCPDCHETCQRCYGRQENQCITCVPPLIFKNGDCLQDCPDGYFVSYGLQESATTENFVNDEYPVTHTGMQAQCLKCSSKCLTCKNTQFECILCADGKAPNDHGECRDTFDGFFYLIFDPSQTGNGQAEGRWERCNFACEQCYERHITTCTKCTGDYVLMDNTCTLNCPSDSFVNQDRACQKCPLECDSCIWSNECTSCKKGFFYLKQQMKCVENCPKGTYLEQSSYNCSQCKQECSSCNSYYKCNSCREGLFLIDGQCKPDCPIGTQASLSTNSCTRCQDRNCLVCDNDFCLECKTGFEIFERKETTDTNGTLATTRVVTECRCLPGFGLLNGVCVQAAPPGFYIDYYKRSIEQCASICATCNEHNDICTSCPSGTFLDKDRQSCNTECPDGTFPNDSVCQRCPSNCKDCTHIDVCQTCQPNLFSLYQERCVERCPQKFYHDKESMKCQLCSNKVHNCETCSYEGEKCTSCSGSLALLDGHCVDLCPKETHILMTNSASTNNVCIQCSSICATCVEQIDKCTSCSEGLFLMANDFECVSRCPQGHYADKESRTCKPCHDKCSLCWGPHEDTCEACNSPFALHKSYCTQQCPEGLVASQGKCVECQGCKECSGKPDTCTSCQEGKWLLNGTCQACDTKCSACEDDVSCTTCAPQYYFNSAGQCVTGSQCGDGFYGNKVTGSCMRCAQNCGTCFGPNRDQCNTCASGFQGAPSCVYSLPNCDQNQYLTVIYASSDPTKDPATTDINISYECLDCPSTCRTCKSAETCLSCQRGYFYTSDIVEPRYSCINVLECEIGSFAYYNHHYKEMMCGQCKDNCLECKLEVIYDQDSMICGKCSEGYILSDSDSRVCVKTQESCSDGQYSIQATTNTGSYFQCVNCPVGCSSCTYQNNRVQCGSCKEDFFLKDNTWCVRKCKENQFIDTTADGCQSCPIQCSSCGSKDKCYSCISGYKLNTKGQCEKIEDVVVLPKCFGDSYYNRNQEMCICKDTTKLYSKDFKACLTQDEWAEKTDCGFGEFFKATLLSCIPCRSNNDELLCNYCQGGFPDQCRECVKGYYLDRSDYSCRPCQDGCERCTSSTTCDVCEKGTFKFVQENSQFGDVRITCNRQQCPVGTLPSVPSLVYQNPQVFMTATTTAATAYISLEDIVQEISSNLRYEVNAGELATAIGRYNKPVFGTSQLPWTYVSGIATYNDVQVVLECQPCINHCSACTHGLFYIEDQQRCVRQCPSGYVATKANGSYTCEEKQVQDTVAITGISHLSASSDGTFSLNKDVVIRGEIEGLSSTTKVWWDLTAQHDILTGQSLELTDYVKTEFFSEVDRQHPTLIIPNYKFQPQRVYVFKLNVDNSSFETKVVVREQEVNRPMEDIGIEPKQIFVEPTEGKSGQTVFYAKYALNIQTMLATEGWIFSISVGETGIIFESKQPEGYFKFVVPGMAQDSDVEIVFIARRGDETLRTSRYISVSGNPNYSPEETLEVIQNCDDSTSINTDELYEQFNAWVNELDKKPTTKTETTDPTVITPVLVENVKKVEEVQKQRAHNIIALVKENVIQEENILNSNKLALEILGKNMDQNMNISEKLQASSNDPNEQFREDQQQISKQMEILMGNSQNDEVKSLMQVQILSISNKSKTQDIEDKLQGTLQINTENKDQLAELKAQIEGQRNISDDNKGQHNTVIMMLEEMLENSEIIPVVENTQDMSQQVANRISEILAYCDMNIRSQTSLGFNLENIMTITQVNIRFFRDLTMQIDELIFLGSKADSDALMNIMDMIHNMIEKQYALIHKMKDTFAQSQEIVMGYQNVVEKMRGLMQFNSENIRREINVIELLHGQDAVNTMDATKAQTEETKAADEKAALENMLTSQDSSTDYAKQLADLRNSYQQQNTSTGTFRRQLQAAGECQRSITPEVINLAASIIKQEKNIKKYKEQIKKLFKDVDALDVKENTMSILNTISLTADKIQEKEVGKLAEQKFKDLAEHIKDTSSMEKYIETIGVYSDISKAGEIEDQTEEDQAATGSDLYNSVIQASYSWSTQFNQGTPTGILDTDLVKGMTENIDLTRKEYEEITPADLQTSSGDVTETRIKAAAFEGQEEVSVVQIISSPDAFKMDNSGAVTVGDQLEIALVDRNATKIKVEDKEEDTISFFVGSTLEVNEEDGLPIAPPKKQVNAVWWDLAKKKYSKSGVKMSEKVKGKKWRKGIKFLASHLTSFTLQETDAEAEKEPTLRDRIYVNGEDSASVLSVAGITLLVLLSLLF